MSQGFENQSADANKSSRHHSKLAEAVEINEIQQSLVEHFGDIKDPRVDRTKKHKLIDIITLVILAVIAGS